MLLLLLTACLPPTALVPPTVDEDASLPTLELDDTLLHGERLGDPDDPLVVLLHGGPGADSVGLRPLTALTELGVQVLIYDQRGSGLSQRHAPGSLDGYTHREDLLALIEAHSPDGTAALVGHSWGGQLAAMFTQAYPERVREVVLLEPGPFNGERWAEMGLTEIDMTATHLNDLMWSEQMLSPDDHARLDLHFLQLMSGQMPGYHFREQDPMPFQRMGFVAYEDVVTAATGPDGLPVFDFATGLEAWPGTAHFVWGSLNTIMDADYRAAQEADWPATTSLVIEGVGHDLPWTATDEILNLLDEVL